MSYPWPNEHYSFASQHHRRRNPLPVRSGSGPATASYYAPYPAVPAAATNLLHNHPHAHSHPHSHTHAHAHSHPHPREHASAPVSAPVPAPIPAPAPTRTSPHVAPPPPHGHVPMHYNYSGSYYVYPEPREYYAASSYVPEHTDHSHPRRRHSQRSSTMYEPSSSRQHASSTDASTFRQHSIDVPPSASTYMAYTESDEGYNYSSGSNRGTQSNGNLVRTPPTDSSQVLSNFEADRVLQQQPLVTESFVSSPERDPTPTLAPKPMGTGKFSRPTKLRQVHKMAERKRRKQMGDLFGKLRDMLPIDKTWKSSQWEILTMTVEQLENLYKENKKLHDENARLLQQFPNVKMESITPESEPSYDKNSTTTPTKTTTSVV